MAAGRPVSVDGNAGYAKSRDWKSIGHNARAIGVKWKLMRKSCLGSGDFFGKEKTKNMEWTFCDILPATFNIMLEV